MDRGGSHSSSRTARRATSTSSRTIDRAISRRPTHPGELFADIVLPELKMSVTEAARQLGVSRQTLHAVMAGRSAVTAEMALRLGRFCGNGPGLWLRMQQSFDLWTAERKLDGELDRIPVHQVAAR